MEAAKQNLLAKGGTLGDWTGLISNGLQPEDLAWVDAATHPGNVLDYARRVMNRDGIMEYECYDARGRPQGKAIIRLLDWDDYALGTLKGVHLNASDPYYDWYARHELKDGRGIYHLCGSKRAQCTARLGRGDKREMVHLERWRMTNPMVMMEHEYSRDVALMAVNNWVNNFAAKVPEPPNPPGPPGGARGVDPTGLDKALAAAGEVEEEDQADKRRKAERTQVEVHPKGSVGMMLEKKAAERRAALAEKERQDHRRRPEGGRSRSRGRRRRRRKRSSSPGEKRPERSGSSGSSQSFREPSTRGGRDVAAESKKPRVPSEEGDGRDVALFSREGTRRRRRHRRMDGSPNDGLHKSGSPDPAPPGGHRGPKPQGASDPGSGHRHAHPGAAGRVGRPPHAEAEGGGNVAGRSGVALSQASGAHSSPCSQPDNGSREASDSSFGDLGKQAEGADTEGEEGRQIGTRRRCSASRGHRDATPIKSADGFEGERPSEGGLQREPSGDRRREHGGEGEPEERGEGQRKRKVEDEAVQEGRKRKEGGRKRRRKGLETQGGGEEGREKSNPPEVLTDQESFETVNPEKEAESSLEMFKRWLESEETGGLSVAQTGALLALSVWRSGTPLGSYLHQGFGARARRRCCRKETKGDSSFTAFT